jgi:LacI family transcriptional regulator
MGPITMKEIAIRAGVSRPTVSRVLNNKASLVTEETREKVLRIARELHYQPNFQAVNLKTKKSYLIGVNFPQGLHYSESSYLTRLQYGLSLAVDKTDYELVFHSSVLGREEAFSMFRSNRIDGYIYVVNGRPAWFMEEMAPYFKEHTIPFVLIHDSSRAAMDFPNVGFNSYRAAYLATEHLITLKHTRIGFVGPVPENQTTETFDGYHQALADHGLAADRQNIYPCNLRFRPVGYGIPEYVFTRPLAGTEGLPSAFVCASDYYAYNLVKNIRELGLSVPGDTAVVSARGELTRFLSTQLALSRNLTTMKQEVVEKGQRAAAMLLDRLENPERTGAPQRVIIEPKLVVRESCGSIKQA